MDLIKYDGPELDSERAKRAVQRFRTMLPGLNGYVRAISGRKDLRIELAAGQPRTDGKRIFFEPPIELGDDLTHERRLCDKRDPESYQQLCAACRVRESLLIKIYHEIAHNVYGTFEMKVTGMDLKKKIYQEINKLEPKRADQIQKHLWTASAASYQELAAQVNPFLPILVNCLEDLRVDEAMFQARKGTRSMFYAMTKDAFENGITQLDGNVAQWKDMPLNSQALVGIFVAGSKYDFTGWFDPKVEAAMRDETIRNLVNDVDQMKSSLETFERVFPLLERLRELGFCLTEEEYDEKEQQDEGDSGEDESAEEDGSAGSDGDGQPADEDSDQASDESSGDRGKSSGTPEDHEGSGSHGSPMEEDSAEQVQEATGAPESESTGDAASDQLGDEDSEGSSSSEHDCDDSSSNRPELADEDEPGSGSGEPQEQDQGSGGSGQGEGGVDDTPEADSAVEELTDEDSSSGREDQQEEGDSGDDSLLDTGADEGRGGIPLKVQYGTAEQAEDTIQAVTKHGEFFESAAGNQRVEERTIVQAMYFEKESGTVSSVKEHFYGDDCDEDAWIRSANYGAQARRRRGIDVEKFEGVGEQVLGPALLHMRRVFADNSRAKVEPHLRSGRVNARVLGKRAPFHDPRLFQKKRLPGKRSYAVLLGIDISGSTIGVNIALAKIAAYAQAELCQRLGIDFAVYAHSATPIGGTHILDMFSIKDFDVPWDDKAKKALLEIGSWSENLDGHSLEYYRKHIERHPATDKIILYYSDGKMPAANYSEELGVLQREIETCKRKNITLLGVGIRTDSPSKHGLDTVQIDDSSEVGKVVRHLESRILHNR